MAEARYRCIWCGGTITVQLPWQGRPQGPQCSCNPNSWGNWQRLPAGVPVLDEGEAVERDGCDPSLLGKKIGYYPDGEPFGYITEQERADAQASRGAKEVGKC